MIDEALERACQQVKERMSPLLPAIAAMQERKAAKVVKMLEKPPLENPEVFDPPGRNTHVQLKKMEKRAGAAADFRARLVLNRSAESLVGSHPVINPKDHEWAADPLVVERLDNLMSLIDSEREDDQAEIALWISPDARHKANTSGGDPYTIVIPNGCADAPLQWESHNTTFVNYLRITFEWGGFPAGSATTLHPGPRSPNLPKGSFLFKGRHGHLDPALQSWQIPRGVGRHGRPRRRPLRT